MTIDSWDQWPLEQLEREYSPSSLAPDFLLTIKQYQTLSAQAFSPPNRVAKVPYGMHPEEFVLVHCADKTVADTAGYSVEYSAEYSAAMRSSAQHCEPAATLVFIHGGYWQELSALDSMFGAQALANLGINWAAINYGSAPNASLELIVQRCKLALAELAKRNPNSLFVLAGSSAGAHLVASLMADAGLMDTLGGRIAGAVLLSGVYDLEPLIDTYINKAVGLTQQSAGQLSPMMQKFKFAFPVLIAYGERETNEFKRQSATFADYLRSFLVSTQSIEVANRDHFDIVFDMSDPDTAIGKSVSSWLSSTAKT